MSCDILSPGRSVSTSGVTGPFRAFPKSLSVDFGGLNHRQGPSLPQSPSQQQQPGATSHPTVPAGSSNAQDRYAAFSQLDSVFSDTGGKKVFFFFSHFAACFYKVTESE